MQLLNRLVLDLSRTTLAAGYRAPSPNGIVAAVRETHLAVPLVVRMKGTNEDIGRKILADSGLPIITANTLAEAADRVVSAWRSSKNAKAA